MIENTKTIKKIKENIMPYIKLCVKPEKFQKLKNFLQEHKVWGKEQYAIQHIGTREKTEEKVLMFQLGFDANKEDAWFIVEEAEVSEKLRAN